MDKLRWAEDEVLLFLQNRSRVIARLTRSSSPRRGSLAKPSEDKMAQMAGGDSASSSLAKTAAMS